MGQRSQIYVRWNVDMKHGANKIQGKGLIARYFSWNYGERMVSRARALIETLTDYLEYPSCFMEEKYSNKISLIAGVNFDMRDVVVTSDCWKDVFESCDIEDLFNQDNSDGQLFIDVTVTDKVKQIKYCFMPFYSDDVEPMDAISYMDWDYKYTKEPEWCKPSKYLSEETVAYTVDNIGFIMGNAKLMTAAELNEFIETAYIYAPDGDPVQNLIDKADELMRSVMKEDEELEIGMYDEEKGLFAISRYSEKRGNAEFIETFQCIAPIAEIRKRVDAAGYAYTF